MGVVWKAFRRCEQLIAFPTFWTQLRRFNYVFVGVTFQPTSQLNIVVDVEEIHLEAKLRAGNEISRGDGGTGAADIGYWLIADVSIVFDLFFLNCYFLIVDGTLQQVFEDRGRVLGRSTPAVSGCSGHISFLLELDVSLSPRLCRKWLR